MASRLDDHLIKIDQKLAVMPLEISKDLLSQAQTDVKLGRFERAASITESANAVIARASVNKLPATSDYFEQTVGALDSMASANQPLLASQIHNTRLMLATYRSSLENPPPKTSDTKTITNSYDASAGQITSASRSTLLFHTGPNEEMINFGPNRRMARNLLFSNINIESLNGSYQIIDGVRWHDVAFVGARIIYEGGELELKNVRFVNCTFEVRSIAPVRTKQFIDYAALAKNELTIS